MSSKFLRVLSAAAFTGSQSITAADQGRPLTPEELSINSRVMGRLIHMLAINQLAPESDPVPPKSGKTESGDPWEDWYY
jgi:hypothetical protein